MWRLALAPASLAALAAGLAREPRCRWFADWGGSLVWVSVDGEETRAGARARAEDLDGRATLFRAMPGTTARIWPAGQPAVQALNARIRASFDPSGLFNPGRLDA
jgi:glycolate oxidase FAD binding subunit